jgi:hypothetical protein
MTETQEPSLKLRTPTQPLHRFVTFLGGEVCMVCSFPQVAHRFVVACCDGCREGPFVLEWRRRLREELGIIYGLDVWLCEKCRWKKDRETPSNPGLVPEENSGQGSSPFVEHPGTRVWKPEEIMDE